MEDQKILELYFSRNQLALQATQEKYGALLERFAFQIVNNREDAEECVNDTYLKTWNAIPPQRPAFFQSFLMKICRHLCFDRLDYKRAQKRSARVVELSEELELMLPDNRTQELISARELGGLINAFLAKLPKDQRMIFVRRYWYMDSIGEIASQFQLSESNVKVILHRLRNKLANHLRKEGIFIGR